MNNQDLIKKLRICGQRNCSECTLDPVDCFELSFMAADAIERLELRNIVISSRDTPMPCTHEESRVEDYTCPMCKNVVSERERWGDSILYIVPKYCKFCGQRICKEENECIKYLSPCR